MGSLPSGVVRRYGGGSATVLRGRYRPGKSRVEQCAHTVDLYYIKNTEIRFSVHGSKLDNQ